MSDVQVELNGAVGCITLSRPRALNALTLPMIRTLTAALLAWRDNPEVLAVVLRGSTRDGPFGALSAGGDIRYFHQAILEGDPSLEDFFTEEYTLNHLIFTYPKPYIAFMDGLVVGGGMGISQGASLRVVTERTRMAMPETNIGLFPDVAGGYFLGRCPGRLGEYLALTGVTIGAQEAVAAGLADGCIDSPQLPVIWDTLMRTPFESSESIEHWIATKFIAGHAQQTGSKGVFNAGIDRFFSMDTVAEIMAALESSGQAWALETAALLRKRSPLMLHVTLEQIRRARKLGLADNLRMERDMVRHCFHLRPGTKGETMEGIRALAIDKDHNPRWNPARIEDVTPDMVSPFFKSPWPAHAHPLASLR